MSETAKSSSFPLIYSRIPEVIGTLKPLEKDKVSSQGYKYRSADSLYTELSKALSLHKVFTTSKIISVKTESRQSKNGGENIYRIFQIEYKFFAEDGSFVEVVTQGEAMDSGDKSSIKAQTNAHKIALIQVFCIPYAEDNDNKGRPQGNDKDETQRDELKNILMKLSGGDGKKASDLLAEFSKYGTSPGKRMVADISPVSLPYVLSKAKEALAKSEPTTQKTTTSNTKAKA